MLLAFALLALAVASMVAFREAGRRRRVRDRLRGLEGAPAPAALRIGPLVGVTAIALAILGVVAGTSVVLRAVPRTELTGVEALGVLVGVLAACAFAVRHGSGHGDGRAASVIGTTERMLARLEVGYAFESAVGAVVREPKGRDAAMKAEWFRFLQDGRLGHGRADALVALARRQSAMELHRVVGAVLAARDDSAALRTQLRTCVLALHAERLAARRQRMRRAAIAMVGVALVAALPLVMIACMRP